jgi:mannan endo-1,4-beta-mannosidase
MRFMRGERPYFFCGANFWYGCYLGASDEGRKRLEKELDQMKSIGITNLRVLGASEESKIERSVSPAIQSASGELNEALLKGLDVLLVEMAKHNMTAVIYLNNYWEWSGGMSTYMSWLSDEPLIDPGATGRWVDFMAYSARFYMNPKAQNRFRDYITTILNRKNTITGIQYKDDPTIMAWELANEPRPGADGENGQLHKGIFLNWIHGIAAYIKSIDKNHLVSTGSEGMHGCLYDEKLFLDTHDGPVIDYLSMHLWPKNWSWFRADKIDETLSPTLQKATAYINKHIELAIKLGKPIVLGEYGMERDGGTFKSDTPVTARDRFLTYVYNIVYENALKGGPLVGTNVWAWGGEGRAKHSNGFWQPGDPFTGDPPQEHQGLNSIFDTDISTHVIIKNHSIKMNDLNAADK